MRQKESPPSAPCRVPSQSVWEVRSRGPGAWLSRQGGEKAILNIDLRVFHGFSIPEVVVKVRQNVARSLLELCGLIAKEINIKVIGIEFRGSVPGRIR